VGAVLENWHSMTWKKIESKITAEGMAGPRFLVYDENRLKANSA